MRIGLTKRLMRRVGASMPTNLIKSGGRGSDRADASAPRSWPSAEGQGARAGPYASRGAVGADTLGACWPAPRSLASNCRLATSPRISWPSWSPRLNDERGRSSMGVLTRAAQSAVNAVWGLANRPPVEKALSPVYGNRGVALASSTSRLPAPGSATSRSRADTALALQLRSMPA